MKRTTLFGLAAAFAALFSFGSPAFAAGTYGPVVDNGTAVKCRTWTSAGSSHPFPGDGVHLYDCVTAVGDPEPQQIRDIYTRVTQINVGASAPAYALLSADGVTYFYFNNRNEANTWFAASSKYSGSNFQATTDRCGKTAYTVGHASPTKPFPIIESSIYKNCLYNNGTVSATNPNIADVVSHESGHAFDFTLAFQTGQSTGNFLIPPSRSKGFRNILNQPYNNATPSIASDFYFLDHGAPGRSAPAPCTVFPNYNLSDLEKDFGPLSTQQICITNPSNPSQLILNTAYSGVSSVTIAGDEIPYFMNPSDPNVKYSEIFAQLFALSIGTGSRAAAPNPTPELGPALPVTNKILPSLKCAQAVVQNYRSHPTLSPVPAITYCPPTTASDYTIQ